MKPTTLGVAGILLSNGKSLVATLQGYEELAVACSECLLLQHVIDSVALLTPEHQEEFMNLDVDDKTVEPSSAKPPLTLSPEYQREARIRAVIGIVMCVVLGLTTLAAMGTVCAVAVMDKTFPDILLIAVILFPTTCIAWQFMGLINKERRDVLSVVLGDNPNSSGILGTVLDVLAARRGKVG